MGLLNFEEYLDIRKAYFYSFLGECAGVFNYPLAYYHIITFVSILKHYE
jgi:hypothetical protein